MKFKAFIFDMDGTIIDTDHIWKKASIDLIETRGITLSSELKEEMQRQTHGLALGSSCAIIKEMFNISDAVEVLIQEKSQRAVSRYKNEVRFVEGFTQFHRNVVQNQLKCGIATNADDATIEATDQSLNLQQFFGKHIYGISQVNNICKPKPDIYLYTAKQLQVLPEECIVLEDSAYGIQAALKAGMYCIGINTSKIPAMTAQAHHIINGYHELNLDDLLIGK